MKRSKPIATMEQDPAGNFRLRGPRRVRDNGKTIAGRVLGKIYRLDGRWHWRIPHPYDRPLRGSAATIEKAVNAAYNALESVEKDRARCERAGRVRSVVSTPMGGQTRRT